MKRRNRKCGSWDRKWREADASLIHNRYHVGYGRWKEFWDRKAAIYDYHQGDDGRGQDEVVAYLIREGLFHPGDRVLDVGCGPGTYTLSFHDLAEDVWGMDISGSMLKLLTVKAEESGVRNIRTVLSSWESFAASEPFDLVFSSFCPAIRSATTLLKMERCSHRGCCYLTGGTIGQPGPMAELHEMLTGRRYSVNGSGGFFSANVLFEAGRRPDIRPFRVNQHRYQDRAWMEQTYLDYFGMFLDQSEAASSKIRQFVDMLPQEEPEDDGIYRAFYAVTWLVPGSHQGEADLGSFLLQEGLVGPGGRALDASRTSILKKGGGFGIERGLLSSTPADMFDLVLAPPFHNHSGIDRAEMAASQYCGVICREMAAPRLFNMLYDNGREPGVKFGLREGHALVWWPLKPGNRCD